jgi:hypothetical protein
MELATSTPFERSLYWLESSMNRKPAKAAVNWMKLQLSDAVAMSRRWPARHVRYRSQDLHPTTSCPCSRSMEAVREAMKPAMPVTSAFISQRKERSGSNLSFDNASAIRQSRNPAILFPFVLGG